MSGPRGHWHHLPASGAPPPASARPPLPYPYLARYGAGEAPSPPPEPPSRGHPERHPRDAPEPPEVEARARARGIELDRELAMLAAELDLGPDHALIRAVRFYRRFARKAHRAGRAPTTFLRELLRAHESADLRDELGRLRERLNHLAVGLERPAERGRAAIPPTEPSPVELYRRLRSAQRVPGTEAAGPDVGVVAAASAERPRLHEGERRAGEEGQQRGGGGEPARPVPVAKGEWLAPPAEPPAPKLVYEDRRTPLRKVTF